jgi:tetratricopeptide (TPR) repeat protein
VARKGGGIVRIAEEALNEIEKRPSLILLLAGNNTFLSEFGPNEQCDSTVQVRGWIERNSELARFLLKRFDRKYGEQIPRSDNESLFDAPICCQRERELLLSKHVSSFAKLLSRARELKIPTVVVGLSGNEYQFAPNRSVTEIEPALKNELQESVLCGQLHHYLGHADEAIRHLKNTLSLDPRFASAQFWLGRSYAMSNNMTLAQQHLEVAVSNDGFPFIALPDFNGYLGRLSDALTTPFIDSAVIGRRYSRTGILDGSLFHDVHHPSLGFYNEIAKAIAEKLHQEYGFPKVVHFEPDTLLSQSGFTLVDIIKLIRGRADWLQRYTRYTNFPRPRLELALGLSEGTLVESPNDAKGIQQSHELRGEINKSPFATPPQRCSLEFDKLGEIENPVNSPFYKEGLNAARNLVKAVATVVASPPRIGGVTSSDYSCLLACTNGVAPDGSGLTINEDTYTHGFGLHPDDVPSYAVFELGGQYQELSIKVGIGDTAGDLASAICKVFLDNSIAVTTPILRFKSPPYPINIPLTKAKKLRLECSNAGDSKDFDVVLWVDGRLR